MLEGYLERLQGVCGRRFTFEDSWPLYRQQMFHALMNWTPTLCPTRHVPAMQPEATSLAMIGRMTAAIDDLDSIGSVGEI